ncbi:MAG: hypothetical protein Q9191_008243 [Dirinaria sp. TL-2023a]
MYTVAGLQQPEDSFGSSSRFIERYGLPPGRKALSKKSLDKKYKRIRVLDAGAAQGGVGALNQGVDLVEAVSGSRQGQCFVLKRIQVEPNKNSVLKREIELLHVLKHPNIVKFIEGYIPANHNGQAQLVMEFCDRGSLQDLIRKYIKYNAALPQDALEDAWIPEAFIWHAFESLMSALAYIHHGVAGNDKSVPSVPKEVEAWPLILHRDIKPDNIFLKSVPSNSFPSPHFPPPHFPHMQSGHVPPQNFTNYAPNSIQPYPRVILADFGVATQKFEPDWENNALCAGTVTWMSPELPDMTARGEVWAVGAVVMSLGLQLKYGPIKEPDDQNLQELKEDQKKFEEWIHTPMARMGVRDRRVEGYSEPLQTLIRKSLRYKSFHRPLSWQLLGEIRTERWKAGCEFEPLPAWAFGKKKKNK